MTTSECFALRSYTVTSRGAIGGWHNTLNEGLYSTMSKAEASRHFLVQTFNEYGYRIFGAFRSSVDFYLHYRLLNIKEHHEVIPGASSQKPRFDIDLEISKMPKESSSEDMIVLGDKIRDAIIVACAKVLHEFKVIDGPNSILEKLSLYTSSTPTKYSLHIVLDKYQHYNHREALEFFKLVVEQSRRDGIYDLQAAVRATILDPGIYKSSQNLRMLGSGKRLEEDMVGKKIIPTIVRPKMYLSTIQIGGITHNFPVPKPGDEVDMMRLFRRSVITDVTGCVHIPVVVPIKPPVSIHLDLPDGYEDAVLNAVEHAEPNTYSIRKSEGSLIDLQRDHPSMCCICKRQHEKIPQYITINRWGDIIFHCRRAEDAHKTDTSIITRKTIGHISDVRVKEEVLGDCDDNDTSDEESDDEYPHPIPSSATPVSQPSCQESKENEKEPTHIAPVAEKFKDSKYLVEPGNPVVFDHTQYRKHSDTTEQTRVVNIPVFKPTHSPTIPPLHLERPRYPPKRVWDSNGHVNRMRDSHKVDIHRVPSMFKEIME